VRSAPPALVLSALAGALCPNPASAQADTARGTSAFMAEFYADVIQHVNEVITDWRRAWREDDAQALSELYFEDARLVLPDRTPIVGGEAIRAFFENELPGLGQIQTSVADFDASGRMAYVTGNFFMEVQADSGTTETVTGVYLTVILRRQRTWRIRSQVFTRSGTRASAVAQGGGRRVQ
jgi:uncharacterized protein (TIGR02246 family)